MGIIYCSEADWDKHLEKVEGSEAFVEEGDRVGLGEGAVEQQQQHKEIPRLPRVMSGSMGSAYRQPTNPRPPSLLG